MERAGQKAGSGQVGLRRFGPGSGRQNEGSGLDCGLIENFSSRVLLPLFSSLATESPVLMSFTTEKRAPRVMWRGSGVFHLQDLGNSFTWKVPSQMPPNLTKVLSLGAKKSALWPRGRHFLVLWKTLTECLVFVTQAKDTETDSRTVTYIWVPVLLAGIFAYLIADCFISIYGVSILRAWPFSSQGYFAHFWCWAASFWEKGVYPLSNKKAV